jgi:hypothetical protein
MPSVGDMGDLLCFALQIKLIIASSVAGTFNKQLQAHLQYTYTRFGVLLHFPVVLLRIPVFRDRDFRILRPLLKKEFESDPDLHDPNPQIPQKRSVK